MPANTSQPALERDAALAHVGGDVELLKELAGLFLEEYPRLLSQLRDALEHRDQGAVQILAHGLKGAAGNFGANRAVEAAGRVERLGREARFAEALLALSALEEVMASLQTELAAL